MKYFYVMLVSLLLVSCGTTNKNDDTVNNTLENETLSSQEKQAVAEIIDIMTTDETQSEVIMEQKAQIEIQNEEPYTDTQTKAS